MLPWGDALPSREKRFLHIVAGDGIKAMTRRQTDRERKSEREGEKKRGIPEWKQGCVTSEHGASWVGEKNSNTTE